MRAPLIVGLLGAATLALGACAGREPNPEPVSWPYDKYYTCQDIRAEKDRIYQAMLDRHVEQAEIHQRDNDLMSRTIPFLAPGVMAVEQTRMSSSAKTPQQVEIDALKARNEHLNGMAADRGC